MIQEKVSGYNPTNDFETELRVLMELSGQRALTSIMQENIVSVHENRALAEATPDEAQEVKDTFVAVREQMLKFDEIVTLFYPIYKKYYSLEGLQELNKFYSTKVMREFVSKTPFIAEETVPLMMAAIERSQQRLIRYLGTGD